MFKLTPQTVLLNTNHLRKSNVSSSSSSGTFCANRHLVYKNLSQSQRLMIDPTYTNASLPIDDLYIKDRPRPHYYTEEEWNLITDYGWYWWVEIGKMLPFKVVVRHLFSPSHSQLLKRYTQLNNQEDVFKLLMESYGYKENTDDSYDCNTDVDEIELSENEDFNIADDDDNNDDGDDNSKNINNNDTEQEYEYTNY